MFFIFIKNKEKAASTSKNDTLSTHKHNTLLNNTLQHNKP